MKINKIAKVPVIMQMEASECGAASLAMILAHHGKWLPIEKIRAECDISRDGSTARNILKAARGYGLAANGYKLEPDELKEIGVFPCIIHWNMNHFVVLKGFRGSKAYINDPAFGDIVIPYEEFDKCFTGICLMFEPTEQFTPDGRRRSVISFAKKRLNKTLREMILMVLISVTGMVVGITTPLFSEYYVDDVAVDSTKESMAVFMALFLTVGAVSFGLEWLKAHYLMKISGKMAVTGSASYLWKVLHLPMSFFSQRMAGDIQKRQSENASVAMTMMETIAPVFLNTVMMGFYFCVMVKYSFRLALIVLISVILNIVISGIVAKKRINLVRVLMMEKGQMYSASATGIDMIETLKASSVENIWLDRWSQSLTAYNNSDNSLKRLDIYLGGLPQLVTDLSTALMLTFGAVLAAKGYFTVGMVSAFMGIVSMFFQPVNTLVASGQKMQEMRAQMERIDDVMEYTDEDTAEETHEEPVDAPVEKAEKLRGKIEVKGLTFGYSRLKPPVVNGIDVSIDIGGSVAIVGASGCGKSSVAKLLAGLYKPWSGEILYDGKPISAVPRNVFTSSVAVVDQDITLFEGSIAENIKMWDKTIEDFEMMLSAKDAGIHELITERDGGYNSRLTVRGDNLSGGQRQCLEIARALAQDPTIMILDEATSALDSKTESEVVGAIKARGITTIVIAHRLSTIRDCDEIIILDNGSVAERGTHDELMKLDGIYKMLVTSE